MYRFGVFVVFTSCLVHIVNSECKDEDFGKIKGNCRRSGLRFDMAETVENKTLVCDCLEELFSCINKHVPNCVDTMEEQYVAFRYTPWDCHVLEYNNSETNRCGDDVILNVRLQNKPDQTVHLDEDKVIQVASASCRILNPYCMVVYITSISFYTRKWIIT